MVKTLDDITGKRFGRWTVIEKADAVNGVCNSKWKCRCDCGNEKIIKGVNLVVGKSKSCGCLKRDISAERYRKHGLWKTKAFKAWEAMIGRCERNTKGSANYRKRGITICPEWRNSFETFYNYVSKLDHYDEDGYTLDRINNNEGYKPGNVRWADIYTQNNNTSRNRYIELFGVTKTLAQWVVEYGANYNTVLARLNNGWPAYEALTKPSRR